METKLCATCQTVRPISDYPRNASKKSGIDSNCKICARARVEQHRQQHPDLHHARVQRDRENNKDRISETKRAYRKSHREQIADYVSAWSKRNVERRRVARQVRRSNINQSSGSFTEAEWIALCQQYGKRCLKCGEQTTLTPDHIVPLCKGGNNDISNIQPLCLPCNLSKGKSIKDYR